MPLKMYQKEEKVSDEKVQHVIGIAAGKGGVGKSSVTVNLALALQSAGYSVGIMDADLYGPSIRKMLPEDVMPEQKGERILPAICKGIKMVSMAYFRKENEAAVIRAPIANGIVTHFIKNVYWGALDFLFIDFPPGTGDIQLTLAQQANLSGAVMVTTPQAVAAMDVRKAMHLFEQVKVPLIGIVENMSYYYHSSTKETIHLFGKGGGEKLAREAGVPFLGSIPIDPAISRCGDAGISLLNDSSSLSVEAFQDLASKVCAHAKAIHPQSKDYFNSFELIWREMS